MVEIALQGESKGIIYEGYTDAFRQCIFEEGNVNGRNERYEFRCDSHLECCGRSCCIPEEVTIPLWLIIIFIILLLILLAAALLTIAYICAKRRKPKPKKDYADGTANKGGYTALETNRSGRSNRGFNDRERLVNEHDTYSSPDHMYGGYGNRTYSHSGSGRPYYGGHIARTGGVSNTAGFNIDDPGVVREVAISKRLDGYNAGPGARRDSRVTVSSAEGEKFIPSPMKEESISAPTPVKIIQRSEDEISRVMVPEQMEAMPLNPQRAQMAFYRPFVADDMEETTMPAPLRGSVSYHSVAELSQTKMPNINPIDPPKGAHAEKMYKRPGFDNVPSY
ncbi:unnamed protein product [Auanema sp. JU1783]|nr:unnamed protein product [Auanema sp. JU1783]